MQLHHLCPTPVTPILQRYPRGVQGTYRTYLHCARRCFVSTASHGLFLMGGLLAPGPGTGLATVGGGGMAVLIHQGEQLPASAQAVFTTVHDNQTEVRPHT